MGVDSLFCANWIY